MKRLSLQIALAILAFIVGVVTTRIYYRLSSEPHFTKETVIPNLAKENISDKLQPTLNKWESGDGIQIKFKNIVERNGDLNAEFYLTNSGTEYIFYEGWAASAPCDLVIKRGNKIVWGRVCDCGTGLETVRLLPRESATLSAPLPKGNRAFMVGLRVMVGKQAQSQIIWSDSVNLQATK